ncbi:hypothetical protein [Salisediminibacterium halotolerans]|uniref:hypothetical protein n=1 Tax=Salisediminibacterium halotolerans TaxID=517425 RepID=UPI000EAC7917|nr:hypothetical protein [Salisediminibacterium halotolerans]RLJ75727.1 hypothetical protein BCL39_1245 [Actinophytocola xinjiangensis]RPE89581.1 hypothetical protein EDD67_0358 [Salisediminibacterium halotolerans]TWG36340.1 hypothetical protein BCL52_1242 [Salisediminibacterium halotolerans]GEL07211.1 hypothetical protein SHA02_06270 [Salisediminibacterium halotolerans]
MKLASRNLDTVIVIAAALFLFASLLLVVAVDIMNVFGVSERLLAAQDGETAYVWYHWYEFPVEVLQWPALAAAMLLFGIIYGNASERSAGADLSPLGPPPIVRRFSLLIAAGLLLMLLEDAGDVRHIITDLMNMITGGAGSGSRYGYAATLFELGYFAALAAVMLFAIVRYRAAFIADRRAVIWLAGGIVFYAVAVTSSWAGSAFGAVLDISQLYTAIGNRAVELLFVNGAHSEALYEQARDTVGNVGFMFMDRVYEETLELMGAAFLLAAAVRVYNLMRQ